jgi:hypothetical protein
MRRDHATNDRLVCRMLTAYDERGYDIETITRPRGSHESESDDYGPNDSSGQLFEGASRWK